MEIKQEETEMTTIESQGGKGIKTEISHEIKTCYVFVICLYIFLNVIYLFCRNFIYICNISM